ncbi:MAG: hypothetical protein K8I30_14760 [Anaerolineae bacterium]|nr:hypothetical protein [Anaerolineae bacterium]
MSDIRRLVIQCYGALLRLYPPQFRAEFADEMQAVFTQAAYEAKGAASVLSFLFAELRDLPLSLVREHLRAFRAERLTLFSEDREFTRSPSVRPFRFYMWSLLISFAVYSLLIILPGLVLGIHTYPIEALYSRDVTDIYYFIYNPQDYPDWIAEICLVLQGTTFLATLFAPLWMMISGAALAMIARRIWGGLNNRQRALGRLALLVPLATLLYIFSPIGQATMMWILD